MRENDRDLNRVKIPLLTHTHTRGGIALCARLRDNDDDPSRITSTIAPKLNKQSSGNLPFEAPTLFKIAKFNWRNFSLFQASEPPQSQGWRLFQLRKPKQNLAQHLNVSLCRRLINWSSRSFRLSLTFHGNAKSSDFHFPSAHRIDQLIVVRGFAVCACLAVQSVTRLESDSLLEICIFRNVSTQSRLTQLSKVIRPTS